MPGSLRVLLVEDDPASAEMVSALLRRGGFEAVIERVETGDAMKTAMESSPWDIVICDYHLPEFGAPEALEVLRLSGLDTPCIVISGTVGEETAVELLKKGAADFVAKDKPLRLVPAIERELREAETRRQRRQSEQSLRDSEERFRALVENLNIGIYRNTPGKDGHFVEANPAIIQMFEAGTREEFLRHNVSELYLDPARRAEFSRKMVEQGFLKSEELQLVTLKGRAFWASVTATAKKDEQGNTYFDGIIEDIAERKQAADALRESEERLRTLLGALLMGVVVVDAESGHILDANPAALDMIGTSRERLVGQICHRNICPAESGKCPIVDLGQTVDRSEKVLIQADGRRLPILKSVVRANLNGRQCLVESFVDISDRKKAEELLRESESRFRALFESSWDAMMTLAPPTWKFTSANPATVRLFGAESEGQFITLGPWNVSPEFQPDGAPSAVKAPQMIMQAMEKGSNFFEWTHQRLNGEAFPATVLLTRMEMNGVPQLQATVRDITREKQAQAELLKLMRAIEQSPACIVITDPEGAIEYVNPRFTTLTGYSMEEARGKNPRILKSGEMSPAAYQELWATIKAGREWHGEFHNKKKNGDLYWELASISPVLDERSHVTHFVAIKEDITERKRLEIELAQARKLESVGQLAAGIAHEINTPTQFVGDNTRFLKDSFAAIVSLLDKYRALQAAVAKTGMEPALSLEVDRAAKEGDLEYLLAEVPKAIDQSLEGIQRISKIVRAMKEFSHPGSVEKELTDINRAIETTVTVARNEWKYVADLEMNLDPGLPPVSCLVGEINQALLNLIVNAAHAIEATGVKESGVKGLIRIATRQDGDAVEIRVSDTGTGIAEEHRKKIFEPFFTTKAVGKGTGQGLTIVYQTVVKKHGGTIRFETEAGKGTTFVIRIPLTISARVAEAGGTDSMNKRS